MCVCTHASVCMCVRTCMRVCGGFQTIMLPTIHQIQILKGCHVYKISLPYSGPPPSCYISILLWIRACLACLTMILCSATFQLTPHMYLLLMKTIGRCPLYFWLQLREHFLNQVRSISQLTDLLVFIFGSLGNMHKLCCEGLQYMHIVTGYLPIICLHWQCLCPLYKASLYFCLCGHK